MTIDSEYNRSFFDAWYDAVRLALDREEQGITVNEGRIHES